MCKRERLRMGLLKIGEMAREAGVLRSTIRYYTEMGLLPVAETLLPGGYRLYDRKQTLVRIQQIKSIAEQNRTLEDIRQELTKSIAG
ncbi:MAG: MerR family transcriptional regulator [Elusimicrobiota bacterium]|nr:MerR family transcriptional regulator [Elusimicrobiota bacterium]